MSRTHEGQWTFSFGNPFHTILHGGSHISPKLEALLKYFEENLSENLKNLTPENSEDVLSLCWIRSAVEFLAEAYAHIKMLINELQLPASDWDEKWIDIYLDSSVKLLDVCNALSSELSCIDQGQVLLQYVVHILDTSKGFPSSEQLRRAHSTLHDWMRKVSSGKSNIDNCATILESLQQESLYLPKAKNCAKGKVLIRALYGVKVMTIFICSIFATVFSGFVKPLVNLPISEKFLWFEAFSYLQSVLNEEVQRQFLCGKMRMFKELEAVETCVSRVLHVLANTGCLNEELLHQSNDINHFEEVTVVNRSADTTGEELKECEGPSKLNGDIDCIEEVILPVTRADTEEVLQESKQSSQQNNDINHVVEVMISEQSADAQGPEEIKETLQQCNAICHTEEVHIREGSDDTKKEELANCKTISHQSNGDGDKKSIDTETEGSQKCNDKPLQQIIGNNQVGEVVPVENADMEEGLEECILILAGKVAVLGSELDAISKQVNYFFRNVLSGRDALLCNFRVYGATEHTNPNDASKNG